jgi:YVTN family beta-propeller protein
MGAALVILGPQAGAAHAEDGTSASTPGTSHRGERASTDPQPRPTSRALSRQARERVATTRVTTPAEHPSRRTRSSTSRDSVDGSTDAGDRSTDAPRGLRTTAAHPARRPTSTAAGLDGITAAHTAAAPEATSTTTNYVGTNSDPFGLAITRNGRTAYAADSDAGTVSRIDLRTGSVGPAMTVGGQPQGLAVSPNGRWVYVLNGADNTMSVINTRTTRVSGVPISLGGLNGDPQAVVVSPNGRRVYVTDAAADTVSFVNALTRRVVATVAVGDAPMGMAVGPGGRRLAVANSDSDTVTLVDTLFRTVTRTVDVGESPTAVAVNRQGSRLYVANAGDTSVDGDGTVAVLNAHTLRPVGSPVTVGDQPTGLALSADGRTLYVANAFSNTVSILDLRTGQTDSVEVGAGPVAVATGRGPSRTLALVANAAMNGTGQAPLTVLARNGEALTLHEAVARRAAVVAAAGGVRRPLLDDDYTKEFYVTNLTSASMVLTGLSFQDRGRGPNPDSTIAPGETQEFVVSQYFFRPSTAAASYTDPATGRTYAVSLFAAPMLQGGSRASCTTGLCSTDGYYGQRIGLLDAPGTSVIIDASRNAEQIKAVNAFCGSSAAQCSFTTTRTVDTYGNPRSTGTVVTNDTGSPLNKGVSITQASSTTMSWKLSAKASVDVMKVVKAEISAEYGKSYTDTHTFTDSITFTVRPGYQGRVIAETPVVRYYGDLTITSGNTQILVKDFFVDAPRPDGELRLRVVETPLS